MNNCRRLAWFAVFVLLFVSLWRKLENTSDPAREPLLVVQDESVPISIQLTSPPTTIPWDIKSLFIGYEKQIKLRDLIQNISKIIPRDFNGDRNNGRRSRSSINEDEYITEFVVNVFFTEDGMSSQMRKGYFVEIGAYDGLMGSTTLYFENGGWDGLLVEASPRMYRKLISNRPIGSTVKRNFAICDKHETNVTFLDSYVGVGGVPQRMSSKFRERFRGTIGSRKVNVQCESLSEVLLSLGVRHVDFWSLDIEGSELVAVKSFDFTKISVGVLAVELDGSDSDRDAEVRLKLLAVGMRFAQRIDVNDVWFDPRKVTLHPSAPHAYLALIVSESDFQKYF